MSIANDKALAVADRLARDKVLPRGAALDPFTILAIISLIIQVVEALWKCYGDAGKAVQRAKSPGIFDRALLRRAVRRNLKDHPLLGTKTNAVTDVVIGEAAGMTEEEMAALHEEANEQSRNGSGN